ncbi:PucR family transcriptional regulator [Desnuesiella massiliensis]|uniref:PucR family transcriptional regulator n=1 Tax=Desnuesiella massiliensis TaxID=1650662 RepID=UPI0006E2FBBE|nr:PucR family transcriptional regulator [Desnuesiella massiliensis]
MNVGEFANCLEEKGFLVIAGEGGLNQEMISINMMENPDTLKWIKAGEFLLTTGYFMKDDEELQLEFINQLSKINAAGIGIKKNRYIGELSPRVLAQADNFRLPIISIPYEYSLSDVSSIFYKELYERQSEVLRKSLNIHEQLMNIVLSGGGIEELSKELINLIHNPLLIANEYGEIIANEGLLDANKMDEELFIKYEQETMVNIDILKSYYNNISKEMPREAIKLITKALGEEITYRIKPIVSEREIYGYIIVGELESKMAELDYIAVERASVIILLERMKQRAIDETKQLMRRDFFDDLLEGKIHSESELENLAMIYGLKPRLNYSCMVVEFKNINDNVLQYYTEKKFASQFREDIFKVVETIGLKAQVKTVSIIRGGYLIIFIPFKNEENHKENRDFCVSYGSILEKALMEKYEDYQLSIGIGKSYTILHQAKSFKEAMESIRIANQFGSDKNIVHFDDFMIYHLLNSSGNTDMLKDFYNNSIRTLAEYDSRNNTDLVSTLEVYFQCKSNMSEAAKNLYIHRNTLLYRLDKIKEILNTDLENGEENLELQLGIHIMKLLALYK